MNMSGESLLVILLVGVIAGWLAGQIVRGTGFGLVGDLIVGIIGAFIGGWLLPRLGIPSGCRDGRGDRQRHHWRHRVAAGRATRPRRRLLGGQRSGPWLGSLEQQLSF